MSREHDFIADAVNLLANSGTGRGHRGRFTGEYMAGITYAAIFFDILIKHNIL